MVDTPDIRDYVDIMNDDFTMTLRMPREMARAVDEFWHEQRLISRNEAIRELLRQALNKQLHDKHAQPAKEQRR